MTYEWQNNHSICVLYQNERWVPVIGPDGKIARDEYGKKKFRKFDQTLEEAPNHWEWDKENLYYINHKDWTRRLVRTNFSYVNPVIILDMIHEKEIKWSDANEVDSYRRKESGYVHKIYEPKIQLMTDWSYIYDGKSVYEFMEDRPKTPYADLVSMVKNEGGYIDNAGIIHKKANCSN